MKIRTLFLSFALAQVFFASVGAQQPPAAEAVPPGSSVPEPRVSPTAAQKEQAKVLRKEAGGAAAKSSTPGEGNPVPDAKTKVSKSDRQQARAARKAESSRASQAGEISSKGETGMAK